MAVIAILARLLAREDFGLVAAAAVCMDYLSTYIGQGLGLAIIQKEKLEKEHLNAVFWINMGVAILLIIGVWFLSPFLAGWLKAPGATDVFRWLSLGLLLQALSAVQMAYLVRQMRFRSVAMLNLIGSLSGGAVAVVLALKGYGVWSLVAQQLFGGAVHRIALWGVTRWKPGIRFSRRHLKELYSFSIFIFLDQQVLFLSRRLDEVIVGGFLGISELGLYSIAKRLVLILQEVIEMPFGQVLISAFSRLQNVPGEMARLANKTFSIVSMVALPAFGGLIALAPEAIELLFGSSWLDATWPVRIMSFGMLLFGIPLTIYPTLLAIGRPSLLLWLNTSSALLGALLLFLGARFGVEGIATAISIRQVVIAIVGIILMRRVIGKSYKINIMHPIFNFAMCSCLAALSAGLLANVMKPLPLPIIATTSALLGAIVYFWAIWITDRTFMRELIATCQSIGVFNPEINAKSR